MDGHPEEPRQAPFRVTFVTGVTPDKWARNWRQHAAGPLELLPVSQADQLQALRSGEADMAFVRLPVDREGLHLIPLYLEAPVVVVSKEHPVAAYDEIPVADLADEHLLQDPDEVPEWRDLATEVREGTRYPVPQMTLAQAVASAAAQAGILVLPMAVARLHHRKDVVAVPVTGVRESQIGLVWPVDSDDPRTETFIGVVRGRTVRSSRGADRSDTPPARKVTPKASRRSPRAPAASRRKRRR